MGIFFHLRLAYLFSPYWFYSSWFTCWLTQLFLLWNSWTLLSLWHLACSDRSLWAYTFGRSAIRRSSLFALLSAARLARSDIFPVLLEPPLEGKTLLCFSDRHLDFLALGLVAPICRSYFSTFRYSSTCVSRWKHFISSFNFFITSVFRHYDTFFRDIFLPLPGLRGLILWDWPSHFGIVLDFPQLHFFILFFSLVVKIKEHFYFFCKSF